MLSPEAIIFCNDESFIVQVVMDLKALGVAHIEIPSRGEAAHGLDFSTSKLKMVIFDFFNSSSDVKLFRKLCEQNAHFTVLKNKNLETCAVWGVNRFIAKTTNLKKVLYAGAPTKSQISAAIDLSRLVENAAACSLVKSVANQNLNQESNNLPSDSDVFDALENGDILPYYQPKICLKTKKIAGVEVLARWRHSKYGLLSPNLFLPTIHKYRKHRELLEILLDQGRDVYRELTCMRDPLDFSFNIEASQLLQDGFASWLINKIHSVGVGSKNFTLEITESSALDDIGMHCIENVTLLTQYGVKLSLDDFGTAYSTFDRLAKLPFKQIKLDYNFIKDIMEEKTGRILASIVFLAKSLELEVVAEGVETESQRIKLEAIGVNSAQGYLFHKPMPGPELMSLIQHNIFCTRN